LLGGLSVKPSVFLGIYREGYEGKGEKENTLAFRRFAYLSLSKRLQTVHTLFFVEILPKQKKYLRLFFSSFVFFAVKYREKLDDLKRIIRRVGTY
jgi:hypothetical protein